MIIVDEPFVAPELVDYLEESQHPVLDNAMARKLAQGRFLNLVDEETCAAELAAGDRLYTTSENALAWVSEHASENARHAIAVFKDKARMRELLAPLNPEVFYRKVAAAELASLDFAELPTPLVVKPSVGFCSVGVYVVEDEAQWQSALADIERNAASWRAWYPESVIGDEFFILESYIAGQEFALDVYYDEDGRPHVLNVLRHDFASAEDTSDRLYCTGASILREWAPRFEEWLARVNERVGARAFPVHVEARVCDGAIVPIEFNPLRFAGLGGTEIAWHAYGFHPYDCYLRDVAPNWDEVLAGKEGKLYCMSLLPAPADVPEGARFDAARFTAPLGRVLQCYEFDPHAVGSYAFVFCETDESDPTDRDRLLREDLEAYVI